jgi:hypothetical protein
MSNGILLLIEDVIFDNIKVLGNRLGVVFYDLQLITEKTNNIKIVNSDIEESVEHQE